jgi:hypothetical protein
MADIERNDDAKQLRDMVDVLHEQGKDAHYILDAIDGYAVGAGLMPPAAQGAVDAALREIVSEARGGDEWVSGHDLTVRVGAIVLDRLGGR